jgi:hypothetical protein
MYALQLQNVKWNVAKKLINPHITKESADNTDNDTDNDNDNDNKSSLYEMQSPLLSKSTDF